MVGAAVADAEERRLRRRRHVVRGRRLPPPPLSGVALAPAAGAVVPSGPGRRGTRPLVPPLVVGVPRGGSVRRVDAVHACRSPLRKPLRSLRHRRPRPRLAPVATVTVTHSVSYPSLSMNGSGVFIIDLVANVDF